MTFRTDSGSVIVTDSDLRTALYTIRSLGRRGVRITAVERALPAIDQLGGLSRYVHRRVILPSSITHPEEFTEALLALAPGHDVILPMGMQSIECVSKHREAFAERLGGAVALAPWPTIERADRTRNLLELAESIGISQPLRYQIGNQETLSAFAARITFPVIVKTGIEGDLPPDSRYGVARGPAEFIALYTRLQVHVEEPIVQEKIEGDGVGFEALYDLSGRPVVTFCHRRLRQYPLTGGPSTFCESIHHPEIEASGRALLDALNWVGLAMVEFKLDNRTGRPMLMEINPRPWGSMALPIVAGVDFPWLWYQISRGVDVGGFAPHPEGVRLRFALPDLRAVIAEWREVGGFFEALRYAGTWLDPRVHEGVLSVSDLRPTLSYVAKGLRRIRSGGSG